MSLIVTNLLAPPPFTKKYTPFSISTTLPYHFVLHSIVTKYYLFVPKYYTPCHSALHSAVTIYYTLL